MDPEVSMIVIRSNDYLKDVYFSNHAQSFFYIKPLNRDWDYTLISCFLNNFLDFSPDKSRGFTTNIKNQEYKTRYIFRHNFYDNNSIFIEIGNEIKVKVSRNFLIDFFMMHERLQYTRMGQYKKTNEYESLNPIIYFDFCINPINNGTNYLFLHKPLIFCQSCEFSDIFDYFCRHISKSGLPNNSDTASIKEYISLFIPQKKY